MASQPLRDVASLILETGMRLGEVFRLRKQDVDFELGYLRVRVGKTKFACKIIPLTTRALEVVNQRVLAVTSDCLFPAPWGPSRPLGSVRKAHEGAAHKAGITPRFHVYELRHTALTRMAMAGVDLPTLRELGGHANIQMTMRYLHPTPEHKVAAIDKLEMFRQESQIQVDRQSQAPISPHAPGILSSLLTSSDDHPS